MVVKCFCPNCERGIEDEGCEICYNGNIYCPDCVPDKYWKTDEAKEIYGE